MATRPVVLELASLLFLLALGARTALGQGCASQTNDVQISISEPPEGIVNLGSNPSYRGEIIRGTTSQIQLDFDPGTPLSQSQQEAKAKLRIDSDAGAFYLQMTQPIDRDGPTYLIFDDNNQYRFTMKCREGGTDYLFEMRLIILDINDNSPQFVGTPYSTSVNELTPVGSSVFIRISATDKDNGANKDIEYSIIPGDGTVTDGSQKFEILLPSRGYVTVKSVLDFESLNAIGQTTYQLNISATDLAIPVTDRRKAFTTLAITIEDGDDLGPQFVYPSCFKYRTVCLNPEYTASVVSGISGGRLIVYPVPSAPGGGSVQILARDQDTLNYTVTFSIEATVPAGYKNYFTLNTLGPTGGLYEAQITQSQAINRAVVPNLRLILRATETSINARYNRANIYLTVAAANGNNPQLSTSTGDQTGYILENSPTDSYVKDQPLRNNMRILVTDPDVSASDPTPRYTYQTVPNTAFRVDNDGYLRLVVQPLDFEANPRYNLNVVVTEADTPERRSATISLTVSVVDVNDNAPAFDTQNYATSVPEGDYSIASGGPRSLPQVRATDVDQGVNGQITYSLTSVSPASPGKFAVSAQGSVQLQGVVRVGERYVLQIKASDGGSPSLSDTAVMVVTVTAGNRGPAIPFAQSTIYVSEGILINSYIWTVPATDPDNDALTYSITAGNDANTFTINTSNGTITNRQRLDRETTPEYTLTLLVRDPSNLSASVRLRIIVTDVNDNTPAFPVGGTYVFSVREQQQPPVPVGTVTATDIDEANTPNSLIRYSIAQDPGAFFQIDANSGAITTRRPLDYETLGQHLIVVQAIDSAAASRTGTVLVTINVIDIDDQVPLFQPTSYEMSVGEDASIGTSVVTVTAVDRDSTPNIVYEMVGADSAAFSINAQTGLISTRQNLDFEIKTRYVFQVTTVGGRSSGQAASTASVTVNVLLRVRACDDGNPPKCNTSTVIITVNRNLFPPAFTVTQYDATIPETQSLGVPIVNLTAKDQDSVAPHNQLVFREVQDGSAALQYFQVDSRIGQISVRQSLMNDLSATTSYTMQVQVGDNGIPQRNSTNLATVRIQVQRNRNPPVFLNTPYNVTIREDLSTSSSVILISTRDADVDSPFNVVGLRVIGDNKGPSFFTLDSSNVVRVSRALTQDRDSSYTLRLLAEDGGQPSKTATAVVYITVNRNLAAPAFQPSSYNAAIPETQALGVGFGLTVSATDADRNPPYNTVRYAMSNNAASSVGREYFLVNSVTGAITVRKDLRLDSQLRTTYTFAIQARDGGSPFRAGQVEVEVTVLRTQGQLAFDAANYNLTISENRPAGGVITTVRAQPGTSIQYSLTGLSSGPTYFAVNAASGQVTIRTDLRSDLSGLTFYQLLVVAVRSDISRQTASAIVNIQVIRNEYGPAFGQLLYNVTIPDTTGLGSQVVTVSASDRDNDVIEYRMMSGPPYSEVFFLNPRSGVISLAQVIRGNNVDRYQFLVQASDQRSPAKTQNATVIVNVLHDLAPPTFINLPNTVSVREDVANGSSVFTVTARDTDLRGQLVFGVNGLGVAQAYFTLVTTGTSSANPRSANVILLDSPSFKNHAQLSYQLRLTVYDSAYPETVTQGILTISAQRNLNAPTFRLGPYRETINESQPLGVSIVQVQASDDDGDKIKYAILQETAQRDLSSGPSEYFFIDTNTGVISLRKSVLSTTINSFTLVVRACDGGHPQRCDTAFLVITVNRTAAAGLGTGAYIGIGIVVGVCIAVCLFGLYLLYRKRSSSSKNTPAENDVHVYDNPLDSPVPQRAPVGHQGDASLYDGLQQELRERPRTASDYETLGTGQIQSTPA